MENPQTGNQRDQVLTLGLKNHIESERLRETQRDSQRHRKLWQERAREGHVFVAEGAFITVGPAKEEGNWLQRRETP